MLSSRKFVMTLLILGIGAVFTWFNKMTPQFQELLIWVGGLYLGFNVTQKATEWTVDKLGTKKQEEAK